MPDDPSLTDPPDSAVPDDPAVPEVVEAVAGDDEHPAGDGSGTAAEGEAVSSPTKLIRIASMVRTMLDEVRQAPLDEAGRKLLREIHERAISELKDVLSENLRDELSDMVLPFTAETPSESELRLAQAQLVGWLEGLFHGIQATLFQQQASVASQLEQVRRRAALEAGVVPTEQKGTGQYL